MDSLLFNLGKNHVLTFSSFCIVSTVKLYKVANMKCRLEGSYSNKKKLTAVSKTEKNEKSNKILMCFGLTENLC